MPISIIKAEAIAAHILYNLTVDKFTFTPGIHKTAKLHWTMELMMFLEQEQL
jgi:hypothetical protein